MNDTDERQESTSFPWPSRLSWTRIGGLFHDCLSTDEIAEGDYQIVWFDQGTQSLEELKRCLIPFLRWHDRRVQLILWLQRCNQARFERYIDTTRLAVQ